MRHHGKNIWHDMTACTDPQVQQAATSMHLFEVLDNGVTSGRVQAF